ncbi:MAG: pyridoxine 5'-phosphate synthase [Alphaproteobacteria bacterium]|nr:pyridoxine 5'-phosphate synthase [Alphaproteobacteria bacterium]
MTLRLGINIDHVATVRNARGGDNPCPVRAALLAAQAGADGITAHLREDRRHIRDADIARLRAEVPLPLNLEMAMTEEMLAIALRTRPHAVCLVPEKREEVTTEGGLDVARLEAQLTPYVKKLQDNGSRVSLFIEAAPAQLQAAARTGARVVELHTGTYAHNPAASEIAKLATGAALAHQLGLEVHAGHGLTFENVGPIAALPEVVELNIGHFLIGEAIFTGLESAIRTMRARMNAARGLAA